MPQLSVRLLTTFVLGVATTTIRPQSAAQAPGTAPVVLVLRIIPARQEYTLNEKILAKYEFFNRSDRTLCLPPPDLKCSNSASGSIRTGLRPSAGIGEQREVFICGFCGGDWGAGAKLPSKIRKHWIKIAPNKSYVTEYTEIEPGLDNLGEWQLEAIYEPPQAAFGDPLRFKEYLREGAERAGCVVPEKVRSEEVVVNVVPPK